jgi:acyl-coenzyme A thioesterase PaaI-like protein
VNLLAPAAGERLVAIGRVVKPARTLTGTQGDAFAEEKGERRLVASMTATLMAVERRERLVD